MIAVKEGKFVLKESRAVQCRVEQIKCGGST